MDQPAKRGRPRSDATRRAVLDAALDELRERGYAALTMERIAARAGASRQTLYRWWTGKADVVLEAIVGLAESLIEVPDTGSLAGDLQKFLVATFRQREQVPVLRGLMAEALLDPDFAEAFRDRFLYGRRAALRSLLQRAVARGELSPRDDLELLIDVVYGVLWYRVMVGHQPLNRATGAALADLLLRAAAQPIE